MSYTVKYDAGEIQDNITTIDKPTIQIDSPRNSKGEITATEIDLTFADPAVDGESATLIKNNLKLANLNRGAIVLDQDTTENSITVDNLESSTAYQATLTQYAEEQIEAYSKVNFSTAQEAPFSISTDTVTLKQGASVEIPFTNDGCSLTAFTDYNLVNVVQNSNTLRLTAVTDDMGSDHLTIVATKNGFMSKTVQITVIVPDVTIECSPLAISIDGDVDEYKDVVVTTNGDSISYSINNDNCSVELLSTSQDGLTATYRVYGESDGGSIITFNALVDGNVVESCTCGVTSSNMYEPQIAFTASQNGSAVNFFSTSSGFNTSDYDVYINDVKTSQVFNSLTFSANDKVQIKANKEVTYFPYFYTNGTDYIKSMDYAFPLMSKDNITGITSFFEGFRNCRSLSSVPRNLFKYNPQITDFCKSFYYCQSLTSVPRNLFKYNIDATFFDECFTSCSSLTTVPSDLFKYNVNAVNFYSCFCDCISLTTIPSDLFRYNVKINNISHCFIGCRSLASIPQDLFRYNVDIPSFYMCFCQCTSLASIPQDLFRYNDNATYFYGSFYNCTSLTTVPSDLFEYNTKIENVSVCFCNCSNITSAIPVLWQSDGQPLPKYSQLTRSGGDYYAHGCTSASNYASIPSGWR